MSESIEAYLGVDVICPGCSGFLTGVPNEDDGEYLRCVTSDCKLKGKKFKRPTVKLEPVEES